MIKLNGAFQWLVLALCLVMGCSWAQTTADLDEKQRNLDIKWREQFWSYLESSEHTQFRTRAAIRLIRSGEPLAIEQGEHLINEVLNEFSKDPASLWLLASDCQWRVSADWCQPGGVYELLTLADPRNAAVVMLRFSQAHFGEDALLDSEANRQVLVEAAQADHFDIYWVRDADKLFEEALKFVEAYPIQIIPEFEDEAQKFGLTQHKAAFYGVMGLILTAPMVGYSNTVQLCQLQAENQHPEGIKACRNLARILRESGNTIITRGIGFGIEKAMLKALDPDDPGIKLWQNRGSVFGVMQSCFMPYWQLNMELSSEEVDAAMMNWTKNISELGEWEGTRLSAFQDYGTTPGHFIVNPADCDKLKDLDDEAMEKLINGQTSAAVWRSMQDEARIPGN
jgi:hypothetical protein